LAHVIVGKYSDHLPLYRQAEIYAREGVELDRTEIVKGLDTSIFDKLVSSYAAASSVDGRLIQTSPGSVLRTG